MSRIRAEIDAGFPCMIGALDMFHLPHFEKLYHKEHIPFHYELATGYDDEAERLYFLDCGRTEVQSIPYEDLRLAFDCAYPGLSKPNTVWTLRMHAVKGKYEIAREALAKKKALYLDPPVGFLGRRGFEKLLRELPKWRDELSKEEYDRILFELVRFLGTVPTVPNALRGIDGPDTMEFCGGFDKAAAVLQSLGTEYHDEGMLRAAEIFGDAAPVMTQIKDVIVAYLTGARDETDRLPALLAQAASAMERGFQSLEV